MNRSNYPDKLILKSHEMGYVESTIILSKKLQSGDIDQKTAMEIYSKHKKDIKKSIPEVISTIDNTLKLIDGEYPRTSAEGVDLMVLENIVNLYTALSNIGISTQDLSKKLKDYKKALKRLSKQETFYEKIDQEILNELEKIVNNIRNDLIMKSRATGKPCRYFPPF